MSALSSWDRGALAGELYVFGLYAGHFNQVGLRSLEEQLEKQPSGDARNGFCFSIARALYCLMDAHCGPRGASRSPTDALGWVEGLRPLRIHALELELAKLRAAEEETRRQLAHR